MLIGYNRKQSTMANLPLITGALGPHPGQVNQIIEAVNGKADTTAVAAKTQTFTMSGFIETPSNKDYGINCNMPFTGTITSVSTICASGTATLAVSVNTTPLGGTANAVSNTLQTQAQTSANTFTVGDKLKLTVSSDSSAADLQWEITYTRSLS